MQWMLGKMKRGYNTLLVWPYPTLPMMTPTKWPLVSWAIQQFRSFLEIGWFFWRLLPYISTCGKSAGVFFSLKSLIIADVEVVDGPTWMVPWPAHLPSWRSCPHGTMEIFTYRTCWWQQDDHLIYAEALGPCRGSRTGLRSSCQFGGSPTEYGVLAAWCRGMIMISSTIFRPTSSSNRFVTFFFNLNQPIRS